MKTKLTVIVFAMTILISIHGGVNIANSFVEGRKVQQAETSLSVANQPTGSDVLDFFVLRDGTGVIKTDTGIWNVDTDTGTWKNIPIPFPVADFSGFTMLDSNTIWFVSNNNESKKILGIILFFLQVTAVIRGLSPR